MQKQETDELNHKLSGGFSLDAEAEVYAAQGKLVAVGNVVRVVGDTAWVQAERNSGCHGCSAESGCGTSALAKLFSPNAGSPIKMSNALGTKPGDKVLLSIVESDLFKHSLMAYGLPLFLMFLLAGIGQGILQSDGIAILMGFTGLALGWWLTRFWYRPVLPKMEKRMTSLSADYREL